MQTLRELYQDLIVDHSRHPRNFREIGDANCFAEGVNPLCGDQLSLYLKVEDNVVIAAGFLGKGCAICISSASLMTEWLRGRTCQEAEAMFIMFHELLTAEPFHSDTEKLGKLKVFAGVRDYPTRVKCATLAWHALHAALNDQSQPVSTEDE